MTKISNKKLFAGLLCSVVALTSVVSTTGVSQAMTTDEAKVVAAKYVPVTAEFVETDLDDGFIEVEFYDKANKKSYEVLVHEKSQGVKQVETSLDNDSGSAVVKLTKAQAIEAVKKEFPSIVKCKVKLDEEEDQYEYDVKFVGKGYKGKAEVNAETGVVLESKIRFISAKSTVLLSKDKAQAIAQAAVKDAKIVKIKLEEEDGVMVYEVKAVKDKVTYELEINARSGQIMDFDMDDDEDQDDDDDQDELALM